MAGVLWLGPHSRSRHHLSVQFGLSDLRFQASYWYADADLYELEATYGSEALERIYFHIAAFTANNLVSLRPDHFDPGEYGRFCTAEFWRLWTEVVRGVWSQWRYEHDLPDYLGPERLDAGASEAVTGAPLEVPPGEVPILAFCGGGKDSVVSLGLLRDAGAPFDTLVYSSSAYGSAALQHALCDRLLDSMAVPQDRRRRIWSFDDLTDSPVLSLGPDCSSLTLTTAETPLSLFAALPLVLQHGYSHLCLGHERSADTGNVTWARTGESVNHQWGKSSEAQELLNAYMGTRLVAGRTYFSSLKPAYDVLIFNLLRESAEVIPFTHSCNVHKPWCGRCAKCAYVWLNYMAYLPREVVEQTFTGHGNLLDAPENQVWFRQLLGLEAHSPFECVGEVGEARLAFELCRRQGLRGAAMDVFEREVPAVDVSGLLSAYLSVDDRAASLPESLRETVLARMRSTAERARVLLDPAMVSPTRDAQPAP